MRHKSKYQTGKNTIMNREVAAGKLRKTLRCSRCRNHGVVVLLRGHKKNCPFRSCSCSKCKLHCERQRILAAQSALQREELISKSYTKEEVKIFQADVKDEDTTSSKSKNGANDHSTSTVRSTVNTSSNYSTTSVSSTTNRGYCETKPIPMPLLGQAFNLQQSIFPRSQANETVGKSNAFLSSSCPTLTTSAMPVDQVVPQKQAHSQYQMYSSLHSALWPPFQQRIPPPDGIQANTTPVVYSNHFQDGRVGLRFRYLNLLARLFPQFSDIFINSVLEDTNFELLTAAEWLVQLEDRRSFMYPAFDGFAPFPVVNQHCDNFDYLHPRPTFFQQPAENKQCPKLSPPNPQSGQVRFGKENYSSKMVPGNQIYPQQGFCNQQVLDAGNTSSSFSSVQPTAQRATDSVSRIATALPPSQGNVQPYFNSKGYGNCVSNSAYSWQNHLQVNRGQNNVSGDTKPLACEKRTIQFPSEGHSVVDLLSNRSKEDQGCRMQGSVDVRSQDCCTDTRASGDTCQAVSFVDYVIQNENNSQGGRKMMDNYEMKENVEDEQKLAAISQYIEEEEGYMDNDAAVEAGSNNCTTNENVGFCGVGTRYGTSKLHCMNRKTEMQRIHSDETDNNSDVSSVAGSEASKLLIIS